MKTMVIAGVKQSSRNPLHSRGFTLIELLVVIAIIGLLSSAILAATSSARVNARNASRNEEAEQLITAFTEAHADGQPFPIPTNPEGFACVSSSCYAGFSSITADPTVTAYVAPYLPQLPSDPPGNEDAYRGGGFLYYWGNADTVYLYWNLENQSGGSSNDYLTNSATSCAGGAAEATIYNSPVEVPPAKEKSYSAKFKFSRHFVALPGSS